MVDDRDLVQALNLLRCSPKFVLRQNGDQRMEVSQIGLVPDDGLRYWIAGESQLPVGRAIPSVFVVENGGGNLSAVYWYIGKEWYKPSEPDTLAKLDMRQEDVFPFDWRYAVAVANDIYHAEPF